MLKKIKTGIVFSIVICNILDLKARLQDFD